MHDNSNNDTGHDRILHNDTAITSTTNLILQAASPNTGTTGRRARSPSNQVRMNAARVVYSRWRILFFWSAIVFNFVQLAVSVGALLASMEKSCDAPLKTFLLIYATLITTNIAVSIYQYRHPIADGVPSISLGRTARIVKQVSESTDFLTIMSYILGNVWLSSAKTCSATAPILFYTALAWVIWGYVLILLPIVALSCIILCLPCFIILFNVFHLGNPVSTRQGANPSQINHLPIIKYGVVEDDKTAENVLNNIIDSEDARCSICLADYQQGDPLRRLPCQHHFHKDCVDQWLAISATCPLCVRSIIGDDVLEQVV